MYQLLKLHSIKVMGGGGGCVIFWRTSRAELQILVDETRHKKGFEYKIGR